MLDTLQQIFPYAIAYTVPLLLTALGAVFCERSGIVNVGLDGLMICGSFVGAYTIVTLQNAGNEYALWIGLFAAFVAGIVFSLLHAFASVTLNANQVISGTAINMIAEALTVFVARNITGSGNIRITLGFVTSDVPILSKIPVIGPLFFTSTYATTWLALAILIISAIVLNKTAFGLRLKACGEHPHAADAAGINVYKVRYIGVMISGALASLSGAVIIVTYGGEFNGSVNGLGFLALAALIFGRWNPFGVLGATLFFGFASTVANVSGIMPALSSVPPVYLKIFPYIATLLVLVFFSKKTRAPKASGEPFAPGK